MSPERGGGEPPKEVEPQPYYQAARYRGEKAARQAYFATQDTIYATECELSTYRMLLNDIWHVAVVGEPPPEELHNQFQRILRFGTPVPLPEDVLTALAERGKQARSQAQWTERHYRPPRPPQQ